MLTDKEPPSGYIVDKIIILKLFWGNYNDPHVHSQTSFGLVKMTEGLYYKK